MRGETLEDESKGRRQDEVPPSAQAWIIASRKVMMGAMIAHRARAGSETSNPFFLKPLEADRDDEQQQSRRGEGRG